MPCTEYLALMLKRFEKPSKHGILGIFFLKCKFDYFFLLFLEKEKPQFSVFFTNLI